MPTFVAVYCSVTLHDCLLRCRPLWLSVAVLPYTTACCDTALRGCLLWCYTLWLSVAQPPLWLSILVLPSMTACCKAALHDCLLLCYSLWFCLCHSVTVTTPVCCCSSLISASCQLQCYRNQSNPAYSWCYVTITVYSNVTIINPVYCGAFVPCLSIAYYHIMPNNFNHWRTLGLHILMTCSRCLEERRECTVKQN